MTFLADTHMALWTLVTPERLSLRAKELVYSTVSGLVLSQASLWEIAIKHSLGKLQLAGSYDAFVSKLEDFGFSFLPIGASHIRFVNRLPYHHKDPFDRMLVAQALVEDLPVLSVDRRLRDYGVRLLI